MNLEEELSREALRPTVLYHATAQRDIVEFEPRQQSVRDPEEGPVVFATPDRAYASMFIVPASDSWTTRGRFGEDQPWHMVISDRDRFETADTGGAIYRLPASSFVCDPARNMSDIEWVSRDGVRPIDAISYDSGLNAMLEAGVQVYFVDQDTFNSIKVSADYGRAIIADLEPLGLPSV